MRKAIIIGEEPTKESKGIEFTHYLNPWMGWTSTHRNVKPISYNKIIYLGKDRTDGDMFACYMGKSILIHKGNLNDGTY
jgi:trehalose-6-phosphatase